MSEKVFRILAINPGSTSTKASVFDNSKEIAGLTVRHDHQQLAGFNTILEQKQLRTDDIIKMLKDNDIPLESLDAVSGRGGVIKPMDSGTYTINERMIEDLHTETAMTHASCLGGIIAGEIGKKQNIPAFIVDPVVVDELEPPARLTGFPEIRRTSIFHALNSKAVARRLAGQMGVRYEDSRFIVAHMGGGITVSAHRNGRAVDVNNGITGEGPFTPERSGAAPLRQIIEMCFSGAYTKAELMSKVLGKGGMSAHLGTSDMQAAEEMIRNGDANAAMVVDAMAYQVAKEIGAMAAVLEGRIDAIILTGGLAHSDSFVQKIITRVDRFAPVHLFPGEGEMPALAEGALRVLRGETPAMTYK